jgi:hypothetical protein
VSAVHIETILLVTGVTTCLVIAGFFTPGAVLKHLFGEERPSASMLLIVRHWSLLISLVGALLVYAAYEPAARQAALAVATVEKLAIAALVVASPARNRRLALVAAGDTMMALIYLVYYLSR